MNVHEPMTLATDYLLTIAAAIFASRLWRTNRMWALAFLFTACGSFFGGTFHGFEPVIAPLAATALWKATVFSIGLASFFLLAGTHRKLIVFATIKVVLYLSWMIFNDHFTWVIADYGLTLLIVGAVFLIRRDAATPWVIGSIIVSVIGALVQMSQIAPYQHFNHNDLYHVIQIVALWLLYRGGTLMSFAERRVMNRSTEPPTIRPM